MSAQTSTGSPTIRFTGKRPPSIEGIDVFDVESAAGCGTLDSLSCLVHGDAIDKEEEPVSLAGNQRSIPI